MVGSRSRTKVFRLVLESEHIINRFEQEFVVSVIVASIESLLAAAIKTWCVDPDKSIRASLIRLTETRARSPREKTPQQRPHTLATQKLPHRAYDYMLQILASNYGEPGRGGDLPASGAIPGTVHPVPTGPNMRGDWRLASAPVAGGCGPGQRGTRPRHKVWRSLPR